jgi:hypothetical protein
MAQIAVATAEAVVRSGRLKLHRGIQRHLQMGIVPHDRFFSILGMMV